MEKVLYRIVSFLSHTEKLSVSINRTIAMACGAIIFLLMLIVVTDVSGRYVLLQPLLGTLEISESLLVIAGFLSLAHVLAQDGHVKITIFVSRLSPERRAWFNTFALAIGFSLMFLMSWRALTYAIYSYESLEVATTSFPLPLYFAKFAFFAGCALLCIQFFIQLLGHFFGMLFSRIHGRKGNLC